MKGSDFIPFEELKEEEKYWLEKLSGQLSETKLLGDFPSKTNFKTSLHKIVFEEWLTDNLKKISKNNDLSLFVFLLTSFKILLFKYTEQHEIIVSSPTYSISHQEYNRIVVFRDFFYQEMTFKEALMTVSQTVQEGYKNQYYPIHRLIDLLDIGENLSLFRIILLYEKIHDKTCIEEIRKDFENDITLTYRETGGRLAADIGYNSGLLEEANIKRMCNSYLHLLAQVVTNINIIIDDIQLMTEEEKNELLYDFNLTQERYPGDKTIHQLFTEQVERTPDNTAVSCPIDRDVNVSGFKSSTTQMIESGTLEKIELIVFKKNPFVYESDLSDYLQVPDYQLLKTHRHNSVVVNQNLLKLLGLFDGKRNVKSIFSLLKHMDLAFIIYSLKTQDVLEISYEFKDEAKIFPLGDIKDFVRLVNSLHRHHLIEPVDFSSGEIDGPGLAPGYFNREEVIEDKIPLNKLLNRDRELSKARVLLLGDTLGTQTIGLLHLAAFLRRKGIKSYCQVYNTDWDHESLRNSIEELLKDIQPEIVAVSMKWFPHIARVIDICNIVKEYAKFHTVAIKVVVGGNTASYYWKEIIRHDCVDYVIRGDGEIPLLQLCQEHEYISNCVYKKDGKIIENPIQYREDENNCKEIYLSHLDEIMISTFASIIGTFFIYTHKGCEMNCFYCGGCNNANKKVFNRSKLFRREVAEVRKDIIEAKKYASTFMFDFDAPNKNLLNYCEKIWEGIDLSAHFCIFTNLIPASPDLICLVNKTFKYVYWNLDVASLSERHRKELFSLRVVKPQPSNREILKVFDECENYDNAEIRFNLIAGLPLFTPEDITHSDRFLDHVLNKYSSCGELHWARLHAQPGAPLALDADKYDMYSYAKTFEDFLKYSQMNFDTKYNVEYYNYPYIYFKNEEFNARISRFYSETNAKIQKYIEEKKENTIIYHNLSYRELNNRANQVAETLIHKGVIRNCPVGLMVQDSLEVAVGILGILKAGSAYLPIDYDYPTERKKYMIKDSNIKIILLGSSLSPVDSITGNQTWISMETLKKQRFTRDTPSQIESMAEPTDLAYAIYTSGTTGKPKGVLVNHKGLVNYTYWRLKSYHYTEKDITLEPLSYCFDGFGSNFYSSLLSGGILLMVPGSRKRDYQYIKEIVKHKGVTNISLIPGMYEALLEIAQGEEIKSIRFVVLAGERSWPKLLEKSADKNPSVNHINEYGPTEATVTAVANLNMNVETTEIIGKPISNTRIYILDTNLNLIPLGASGELCIEGVGLAYGYLNNPGLTAERFRRTAISNSSLVIRRSQKTNQRLYQTGDRARWLYDGNIELLGRIDQQLKIRGYRIEVEEIENRMMKYDKVKEAVVIAREAPINSEYGGSDKNLYAYFVSEETPDISQLKRFLAEELPDYMLPAHFIQVERIPLTPNGKLDREALPVPGISAEIISPRNESQEKLAKIWAEILHIEKERISIDHNFFQLGGHSLKAVVEIAKIHEVFNVKIQLADVFKRPTIRELSEFIQGAAGHRFSPLETTEEKEYYSLSSAQKRLYIIQQMHPQNTQYNNPIFSLVEAKENLGKESLTNIFKKLIKRHTSFRVSFIIVEDVPVQLVHRDMEFSLEYDEMSEEEAIAKIRCFVRPFDLSQAPLLRVELIKISETGYILMVDIHHIITDGISMNILLEEFMALHEGRELPPLRLQYKDYAQWEIRQTVTGKLKKQEEYWLNIFNGSGNQAKIPVLNLPTDYPRSLSADFSGNSWDFKIDSQLTHKLKKLMSETDTTLYMMLLAVYTVLLSKYTGQEDITVGSPIAGRTHNDLKHIIGMFVNMVAMRNFPQGTKTFREFLLELKENAIKAYENQDYPFDMLVGKLNLQTEPGRHPLVDTVLVLNNIAEPHELSQPPSQTRAKSEHLTSSLSVKRYGREHRTAKFDLYLAAFETQQEIKCRLEYRCQLFQPETIERMSQHFRNLLEKIIENPDTKISNIDLLDVEEINGLLTKIRDNDDFTFNQQENEKILPETDKEKKMIDCFFIGHNEMDFAEYEKRVRQMGIHSGAYRDLGKNFLCYNNTLYHISEIFNIFCRNNGDPIGSDNIKPLSMGDTFNLAIAYLGSYLHNRNLSFDYVNAFQDEKELLAEKLAKNNILAIAIITTLYVSAFPILEIIRFIKKYNNTAMIIVGGPFIANQVRSLSPVELEYLFESVGGDFYVNSTQGEAALVEIITALKKKLPLEQINNIYYNVNGNFQKTPTRKENNRLAENMVNWDLFSPATNRYGHLNIRTSISCPFSCSFCGFPEHAGPYQTVGIEEIQEELDQANKIKALTSVQFVDDTFNVPVKRFKEILKMMIKNQYKFKWHSHFRCQYADRETVELMKASGCEGVYLGIESGSDHILKIMNKASKVEQYFRGVRLLKEYGILTYGSFIIGFPGETHETVQETIQFIKESGIDFYRTQLWYCDTLTPIWKEREKYNIKGSHFEWTHATMDAKTAADITDEIFLSIENPIWVPQYNFEFYGLFHLLHRGFSPLQVKNFLNAFNRGIKEKLIGSSKEISREVIEELEASLRKNHIPGKKRKGNQREDEEAEFDFN